MGDLEPKPTAWSSSKLGSSDGMDTRCHNALSVLCQYQMQVKIIGSLIEARINLPSVTDTPTLPYKGYRGCFPLRGSKYIIWWWAALCIWDFSEWSLTLQGSFDCWTLIVVCLALVLKPAVNFCTFDSGFFLCSSQWTFISVRSSMRSRLPLSLVVYRDGLCCFIFPMSISSSHDPSLGLLFYVFLFGGFNYFAIGLRWRTSSVLPHQRRFLCGISGMFIYIIDRQLLLIPLQLTLRVMGTAYDNLNRISSSQTRYSHPLCSSLTRCLHSMLASRALLQMREELQRPTTTTDFFPSALQHDTNTDTVAFSEVDHQSASSWMVFETS